MSVAGVSAHQERGRAAAEPAAHAAQAVHPGSPRPHPARREGAPAALRQLQGLQC